MSLILDTNAYSALMQGHAGTAARVREARAVRIPSVVLGELLAGFRAGNRESKNRDALERLLQHPLFDVLPVTQATAEHYAAIWMELRRRGTPIPTNDLWIAAQARETHGELLSFDRHFDAVDGIRFSRLVDPSRSS